jgi:uncharacterized protein (DUF1697 family)
MTTYIAMLRGINVSGHKPVKMEALRAAMAELGLRDVKTYVQSGNLVFTARPDTRWSAKMERRIQDEFGFDVPVVVRTAAELGAVVAGNPFVGDPAVDHSKLHVTFLGESASKTASTLLQPLAAEGEQVRVEGREVYLYCPHGYGRTKLSNTAIEKKLGLTATTRNWKTVQTLLAMAQ